MQKQAPTLGRILVMVGFALSCFGLLLFLWLAFGGPIPLKPKGYRFHVRFGEADAARQGGRRPHLRRVGRQGQGRSTPTGRPAASDATIELDARVRADPEGHEGDPAPEDAARRDLRRADAGHQERRDAARGRPPARRRRSSPTVELDEIFRAFDAKTREAFQIWMQQLARGLTGAAAQDINDALGNLRRSPRTPTTLLRILNAQQADVPRLVAQHRRRSSTR